MVGRAWALVSWLLGRPQFQLLTGQVSSPLLPFLSVYQVRLNFLHFQALPDLFTQRSFLSAWFYQCTISFLPSLYPGGTW